MKRRLSLTVLTLTTALIVFGCGKKKESETETEMAQQIGDAMASADESSGSSSGDIARNEVKAAERSYARLDPRDSLPTRLSEKGLDFLFPTANAVSCFIAPGFGSCSANTIIRNFNGCTIGASALSGTVTLAWSGGAANCLISANGHTISRVPDFTISGRRGGTLAVSKTGTFGQRLTRSAPNTFQFTNDGIRRVIAYNGTSLFDFTTTTTGPLTLTGAHRNGRTFSSSGGGALRVMNNSSGVSCDFVPTNVTWSDTCTCAVSGTWDATCSDGKTASVALTGCGSGTLTVDGESAAVSFDRCYGT